MTPPAQRPAEPGTPWWAYVLFAAYLSAMAVGLLWPDGGVITSLNRALQAGYVYVLGAPPSLPMSFWAQLHNVLVFIPPAAAAMLVWRHSRGRRWVLLALALSGGVELVQLWLLPGRVPQLEDIAANTLGAFAGVTIGGWLRARRQARLMPPIEHRRPGAGR